MKFQKERFRILSIEYLADHSLKFQKELFRILSIEHLADHSFKIYRSKIERTISLIDEDKEY